MPVIQGRGNESRRDRGVARKEWVYAKLGHILLSGSRANVTDELPGYGRGSASQQMRRRRGTDRWRSGGVRMTGCGADAHAMDGGDPWISRPTCDLRGTGTCVARARGLVVHASDAGQVEGHVVCAALGGESSPGGWWRRSGGLVGWGATTSRSSTGQWRRVGAGSGATDGVEVVARRVRRGRGRDCEVGEEGVQTKKARMEGWGTYEKRRGFARFEQKGRVCGAIAAQTPGLIWET
ncbi:hypothetical protein B0H10DRAFT_1964695 [Mycena sp. CBHHK59/15]|nr:hypothetical protein B0H10DRAFT_1964695 [Mycena sp. CBHHK59/15]